MDRQEGGRCCVRVSEPMEGGGGVRVVCGMQGIGLYWIHVIDWLVDWLIG